MKMDLEIWTSTKDYQMLARFLDWKRANDFMCRDARMWDQANLFKKRWNRRRTLLAIQLLRLVSPRAMNGKTATKVLEWCEANADDDGWNPAEVHARFSMQSLEYHNGELLQWLIDRSDSLIPSAEHWHKHLSPEVICDCIREVFGANPMNEYSLKPAALSWQGGFLPATARDIHERQAWGEMYVLADALEEGGCTDQVLLDHLRGQVCPYCKDADFAVSDAGIEWEQGQGSTGQILRKYTMQQCVCKGTRRLQAQHFRGCWVLHLFMET